MTWLWCSNLSRMDVAATVSPSSSPQSTKPLFEASMILPRSYVADARLNYAVADSLRSSSVILVTFEGLVSMMFPLAGLRRVDIRV